MRNDISIYSIWEYTCAYTSRRVNTCAIFHWWGKSVDNSNFRLWKAAGDSKRRREAKYTSSDDNNVSWEYWLLRGGGHYSTCVIRDC